MNGCSEKHYPGHTASAVTASPDAVSSRSSLRGVTADQPDHLGVDELRRGLLAVHSQGPPGGLDMPTMGDDLVEHRRVNDQHAATHRGASSSASMTSEERTGAPRRSTWCSHSTMLGRRAMRSSLLAEELRDTDAELRRPHAESAIGLVVEVADLHCLGHATTVTCR